MAHPSGQDAWSAADHGPWRPRYRLDDALEDALPVSETHLWGTVRGAGVVACPVRSVLHSPGVRGRRLLWNEGSSSGLRLRPAGGGTARGGPADVIATGGDGAILRSPRDADGSSWQAEIGPRSVRWSEGDLLDLTGTATGPALWWELGTGAGRMAYRLQVLDVRGTAAGREVSGFAGLDRVHLLAGQAFYRDDPVAVHGLLVAMFSFATEYGDGSIDSGALAVGHGGFAVATITSAGRTLATDDVSVRVHRDESGYWPIRMDVIVAGEEWEWTGDVSGRFVDYGMLDNPQTDGILRRVGDDRPVLRWFAQGETVPGHGDEPRRR